MRPVRRPARPPGGRRPPRQPRRAAVVADDASRSWARAAAEARWMASSVRSTRRLDRRGDADHGGVQGDRRDPGADLIDAPGRRPGPPGSAARRTSTRPTTLAACDRVLREVREQGRRLGLGRLELHDRRRVEVDWSPSSSSRIRARTSGVRRPGADGRRQPEVGRGCRPPAGRLALGDQAVQRAPGAAGAAGPGGRPAGRARSPRASRRPPPVGGRRTGSGAARGRPPAPAHARPGAPARPRARAASGSARETCRAHSCSTW